MPQAHLPPAAFGAAGLFDVLEHVENEHAFLDQVAETLAPGGLLYLTVPAFAWLWSVSDPQAGHYRRYDRTALERVLQGRFDMLYFSGIFLPLLPLLFLCRALPFRMGLARKNQILDARAEHGSDNGLVVRLLKRILCSEVNSIRMGHSRMIGSSWLCVARKRT